MNKYNLTKQDVIDKLNVNPQQREMLENNIILLFVSGSNSYGMNTEHSDTDVRGLFIANEVNILGNEIVEQFANTTNDIVIYEFKKAVTLIAEQNPNMLEILWVDEEDIIFANEFYYSLRSKRDLLLSSLAKIKFTSYAFSQLKRIRGHNKWLEQERNGTISIDKQPKIETYCRAIFTDGNTEKLVNCEDLSNVFLTKESSTVFKMWKHPSIVLDSFVGKNQGFRFQESRPKDSVFVGNLFYDKNNFDSDNKTWNEYRTWKENRSEVRHELEEKYGYDSKHASHTIRLLRMGVEILRDKKVYVKRPDAKELLEIRNGKLTYEELLNEAEQLDKLCNELYLTTTLPRAVDVKVVNEILVGTYLNFWKVKNEKTTTNNHLMF